MSKNISILGCGWLGLPLAKTLVARGYRVSGSTTSSNKLAELEDAQITPYLLEFTDQNAVQTKIPEEFLNSDVLIICIPPRIRRLGAKHGLHLMKNLLECIKNVQSRIIYTSSTSVYPANNQICAEDAYPPTPGDHPILEIEYMLQQRFAPDLSILRLGGLFGYDRIPIKYYSGKSAIKNASNPVNYVHRDDVIRGITKCIEQEKWGKIYNIVAPLHPARATVFQYIASVSHYEMPELDFERKDRYKIISGDKFSTELGFNFKYPNPLYFEYQLPEIQNGN